MYKTGPGPSRFHPSIRQEPKGENPGETSQAGGSFSRNIHPALSSRPGKSPEPGVASSRPRHPLRPKQKEEFLRACLERGDVKKFQEILRFDRTNGIKSEPPVYNMWLRYCVNQGHAGPALKTVELMRANQVPMDEKLRQKLPSVLNKFKWEKGVESGALLPGLGYSSATDSLSFHELQVLAKGSLDGCLPPELACDLFDYHCDNTPNFPGQKTFLVFNAEDTELICRFDQHIHKKDMRLVEVPFMAVGPLKSFSVKQKKY